MSTSLPEGEPTSLDEILDNCIFDAKDPENHSMATNKAKQAILAELEGLKEHKETAWDILDVQHTAIPLSALDQLIEKWRGQS